MITKQLLSALLALVTIFLVQDIYPQMTADGKIAENLQNRKQYYEPNQNFSGSGINSDSFGSCTNTWTSQFQGFSIDIEAVSVLNENVCWYTTYSTGLIYKTTDGGITWDNAMPSPFINGTIRPIAALSGTSALFAYTNSWPNGTAIIYKTTNSGQNWVPVFSLPGGFINGIKMINSTTGYAQGPPVNGKWTILKTTNSGDNWETMQTAPDQIGNDVGVIDGFRAQGPHLFFTTWTGSRLYRSTDHGINWTYSSITPPAIYLLHFNDADNGVLISTNNKLRTTDGGQTFLPVNNLNGFIMRISGDGSNTYWALNLNKILRSTNNGADFGEVFTASNDLYGFDVYTNGCSIGWAGGDAGTAIKMDLVLTGINSNGTIPENFYLFQNYPNPFNPSTKISFVLPQANNVKLTVYDALGREVAVLVNEFRQAGQWNAEFNASALSSGIYFYRLEAGSFTETKKMLLIK
jgi:hypothetical protein